MADGELDDGPTCAASWSAGSGGCDPDVVLGHDPTAVFFGQDYFNHRDHRTAGWALLDALSPAAALPHYFPEAGPPHQVATVYLSGTLDPDVWVDIIGADRGQGGRGRVPPEPVRRRPAGGPGRPSACGPRRRGAGPACPSPRGSAACGSVAEGPTRVPGRSVEVELVPAILHVDMDAFFAAVEVLDDPELAGRPVIVGGSGARGRGGLVHLRGPGLRGPLGHALGPGPPALSRGRLRRRSLLPLRRGEPANSDEILLTVTPLVEPIGLDEAFLDVTGARRLLGAPEAIAHRLRARVAAELSLDCSVGVGRSKLVAKLASRAAKPRADRRGHAGRGRAWWWCGPAEELGFLHPLPVRGAVGGRAGHRQPAARAGRPHGGRPGGPARGDRWSVGSAGPTAPTWPPWPGARTRARWWPTGRPSRSGHEETFAADVARPATSWPPRPADGRVGGRPPAPGELAGRTVTVKVRYADFSTGHPLPHPRRSPSTPPRRSPPWPAPCSRRWISATGSACSGSASRASTSRRPPSS